MDPISLAARTATLANLAVTASQALSQLCSELRAVDHGLDELYAETQMLQGVLSHLGPELSTAERLPQTHRLTLSEVVTACTVSLEELLSLLEQAQFRAGCGRGELLAYIRFCKGLGSTRDKIRHQTETFQLLRTSMQYAKLDGQIDAAKDKDQQHENPIVTGFRPKIADFGVIYEDRPETAEWPQSADAKPMMPEHSGHGRDSNEAGMEADGKTSQPKKRWEGTGSELSHSNLALHSRLHDDTNCQTLLSRWVEGSLVGVSAAGAAMMGYWAQIQNSNILGLDLAHTAGLHNYKVMEFISLQTLIPKAVLDSPGTLVISIAVTTLALTAYHYRHRYEKYQDPLIFAIGGGGALVGRLAGLDGTGVLLRVVPWCVLVSLLLSAAWSPRLAGGKPCPRVDDDGSMRLGLKSGALGSM